MFFKYGSLSGNHGVLVKHHPCYSLPLISSWLSLTIIIIILVHFRTERSTDQVIKPVNVEALSRWVHAVPEDVKRDAASIAPMLAKMGYDPAAYPPNYGDPDAFVAENTQHIRSHEDYWRRKGQEVLVQGKGARSNVSADGGAGAEGAYKKAQTIYKDVEQKGDLGGGPVGDAQNGGR
jgi:hypothetical protein